MLERVRCAQVRDKGSVVELGQRKCVNVCLSVCPCRHPPLHTPHACYLLGLHARHKVSPCSSLLARSLSDPLYFRVMEISVPSFVFFLDKRIPSSSLPSSSTRSYYALHGFFLLLLPLLTLDYPMLFTGSLFFSYFFQLSITINMLLTGFLCFFFGDMFGTQQ